MTVGISDCDGQLVNAGTGTPEGAVDISAFAELLKQPPGQRLVAVNLPEAGALVIDGVIFDEAPHILRRIAEKQPYLMREISALASFVCLSVSIV